MRIQQGLEAPQSGQASTAHYMYQEALFKLKSNRDNGNGWSESDAIAALHLVSYSHLSGGSADWQEPFDILCAWLLQSSLSIAGDNSRTILQSMTVASQLLVKLIMVSPFRLSVHLALLIILTVVGHLLEPVVHASS